VVGPDGVPIEDDYSFILFYWNEEHYEIPSSEFTYKRGELTAEEAEDYDRLVAFVGAFPANLLEDSEGNPLLDDNGQQKTSAKLVDTKRLLGCKTPEEVESFWRDMTSVQARLRAAKNAKKKTFETVSAGTPSG
ncbi:hypothetical protein A2U01_0049028, partial [Trifolium medium]|nr:hypothetical protein [Trifolium medium]